ncbi:MAG: endopeptidase La [Verrucomicrobiota bacterium]|nr:endopeptidase La [Verrucomicrobiota bacterium]
MHVDQDIIDILKIKASSKIVGSPEDKSSTSLSEHLPILGLSDIVIFPGMVAPLLIESTSSSDLIDDVVSGNRLIGLVLQTSPVDDPAPKDLHEFGCLARVQKMVKQPNQQVRILIEGLKRIRILDFKQTDPYLLARVEYLDEPAQVSVEAKALARTSKKLFQEILEHSPTMTDQVKSTSLNVEDPEKLSDLIGANLNLKLQEHQTLLSSYMVVERFKILLPLLKHELEIQSIGARIQKETSSSISKSQRNFYLREQLRIIQRELGEEDPSASEMTSLKSLIDGSGMPEETRAVALKELDRLKNIPVAVPEYSVSRHYVEWLASLPWATSVQHRLDLEEASQILEREHFGLKQVKDRLLEHLAVMKQSRAARGPILCLVGPPGVGKTSLGRSIAESLGRPFARISLGGIRDEAEIRGHRRTYVGSMPGRIIQTIKRLGARNPVILLDEIDKMGSDFRGDPASALLEVLDPQQNKNFSDHYLEVPFDLSEILFITTANWLEPVHPALKDRLEVIELSSYTTAEKVQITKRHLLPRQLKDHGLSNRQIKMPAASIRCLVELYTREAGVRQLERSIAAVLRKATREQMESHGRISSTLVTEDWIDHQLGVPKHPAPDHESIEDSGIAVGLGWTPSGGEILYVEATSLPGRGKLILTGSLGDVMKESAQAALTHLRSQAGDMGVKLPAMDALDIHIHVPAGATPKDGPSAGIAIFAALASLFMGKPLSSRLAMTGEISLRGRVLPVGGVREKLLAAVRSGVREVVLPEANRKDWEKAPTEIGKKLNIHWIKHVQDMMDVIFKTNLRGKKG